MRVEDGSVGIYGEERREVGCGVFLFFYINIYKISVF